MKITFLVTFNFTDLHHLQGGMKFATKMSTLLGYNYKFLPLKSKPFVDRKKSEKKKY